MAQDNRILIYSQYKQLLDVETTVEMKNYYNIETSVTRHLRATFKESWIPISQYLNALSLKCWNPQCSCVPLTMLETNIVLYYRLYGTNVMFCSTCSQEKINNKHYLINSEEFSRIMILSTVYKMT